jgi:hypothetical protein
VIPSTGRLLRCDNPSALKVAFIDVKVAFIDGGAYYFTKSLLADYLLVSVMGLASEQEISGTR